jgi:hypothetical protein
MPLYPFPEGNGFTGMWIKQLVKESMKEVKDVANKR